MVAVAYAGVVWDAPDQDYTRYAAARKMDDISVQDEWNLLLDIVDAEFNSDVYRQASFARFQRAQMSLDDLVEKWVPFVKYSAFVNHFISNYTLYPGRPVAYALAQRWKEAK